MPLNFNRNYLLLLKYIPALFFIAAFVSCAKLPVSYYRYSNIKKLETGPGPEDMVLDTISSDMPRLLVSCSERRARNPESGDIYSLDITSRKSTIMTRTNEPADMIFRPHGIDLVKNKDGELLLYCVTHNDCMQEHSIIIYKVFGDRLEFISKLDDPLLVSPNDLTANPDGNIYVTNDAGKRGSVAEAVFKLKRGTVVEYDPANAKWKIFADRLLHANGIAITNDDKIVVSTVRQDALFIFNKDGSGRCVVAELAGLDNLCFVNESEILVTAHPSLLKFLKHLQKAENKSPSIVYKVNLNTREAQVFFADDGELISAASTAILYKGKLYICQVFDPFILECSLAVTE